MCLNIVKCVLKSVAVDLEGDPTSKNVPWFPGLSTGWGVMWRKRAELDKFPIQCKREVQSDCCKLRSTSASEANKNEMFGSKQTKE
ncbi:hypothetical protein TNCT_576141 [Trichonephila clavata]|uniref:Uncharacterized protein n=1 Tax=Trichonephila clavata TaxID=2740835 RepID=A0A8X6J9S0_TRICU|nr:hypothetical protein TNCT_576141 [Trichonephila clavata]